jgi:hypothetical protein
MVAFGTAFGMAPDPKNDYAELQSRENDLRAESDVTSGRRGWDTPVTLRGVAIGAVCFVAFALCLWLVDLVTRWLRSGSSL